KAHTREGDAIAAARRRLPMVEVNSATPLIGPHGPVTLLEAFEGRRQLIAYYFMWSPGRPAAEQCEGCTRDTSQALEQSFMPARDVETMNNSYALLDMTIYGREEWWEDSPAGWPHRGDVNDDQYRTNGRPIAQWSRLEAGHSDDLAVAGS